MLGFGLIATILVGGIAGWIASRLMKARTGVLANVGLGVLGAVVANAILRAVGLAANPTLLSQLIIAIGGAALLIALYRALRT